MIDYPSLSGQLLLAMPGIGDGRFERSVIYMCQHSAEGAMGLIVNKRFQSLKLPDLMSQLDIRMTTPREEDALAGGPVEPGRGFVLHSTDYRAPGTLVVSETLGLTHTVDILRAIAEGAGPHDSLIALGYSGWAPGQLERELGQHGWLTAPATPDVLFHMPLEERWAAAVASIGIDPRLMTAETGNA